MPTVYQEIVAGKVKGLREIEELNQREEAEREGQKQQWEDWSKGMMTQAFLRELDFLVGELDTKIDAYIRGEIDRERALLVAVEQNTLKRVVQLVKTGKYEPKGNILYK